MDRNDPKDARFFDTLPHSGSSSYVPDYSRMSGSVVEYGQLGGSDVDPAYSARSIACALNAAHEGNARLRGLEERLSQIADTLGGAEPKAGAQTQRENVSSSEVRPLVDEAMYAVREEHELISRIEGFIRRIHEALGV